MFLQFSPRWPIYHKILLRFLRNIPQLRLVKNSHTHTFFKTGSTPNNALLASYKMVTGKGKKLHSIAKQLLPAAFKSGLIQ